MSSASSCDYWWDDATKYGLSVHTAPTAEPVSVSEVRSNSRIDSMEEGVWIAKAILAAREKCETFLKRRFVSTTLRLTLDRFPSWEFYLPSPPLVSVTSVKYYDLAGVQQTISASNYSVDIYTQPGRITPAYGLSWPTARVHTNSIEVLYVAGYGGASAVPFAIKQAILLTVGSWFETRENIGQNMNELPDTAKALLRSQAWGFLP